MKKEIKKILYANFGYGNADEATKELLDLFNVSQRSELLSDFEKWLDKKGNENYCSLPAGYVLNKYKLLNC